MVILWLSPLFLIGNILSGFVQFRAGLITRKYCQWTARLVGPAVGVEVDVAQCFCITQS